MLDDSERGFLEVLTDSCCSSNIWSQRCEIHQKVELELEWSLMGPLFLLEMLVAEKARFVDGYVKMTILRRLLHCQTSCFIIQGFLHIFGYFQTEKLQSEKIKFSLSTLENSSRKCARVWGTSAMK